MDCKRHRERISGGVQGIGVGMLLVVILRLDVTNSFVLMGIMAAALVLSLSGQLIRELSVYRDQPNQSPGRSVLLITLAAVLGLLVSFLVSRAIRIYTSL